MNDSLAEWLVRETDKRHWSLREIARQTGLSQTTVAKIANGERTKIKGETAALLAEVFGVKPEEVLHMAGYIKTPPSHRIRSPRIVYETDSNERLLKLWEGLGDDDRRMVLGFMERLAPPLDPRIIGDAPPSED